MEYKGHTVRLRSFSDKGGLADYITPIKSVNSWGDEVTHSTVWVPADIVFSQLGKSEEYTINENVSYKEKNLSPREQTRYGINYPGARINTYSDGEIVGAIEIYFKNNNAYVSLVQVDTAFQRQGIGKELYRRAIALSCDHRCKNFYSDTGNYMSLPAHNLWNRLRDEYKVDFETDKGGYDSTGRKKISLSNIKEWKDYVPPVQNPAFLAWCNGSKVVDSSGNPLIVYHGTTHDFNKFDDSSSNPANHYGRALYFTSSKTDTENYAGIGPDLTSRIEHEADKLMSEWEWSDNEEYKGKSWNELYQLAKAEVSKKLKGPHEGFVMPCYLRMIKPVIVSKQGGTYFDVGYNYRTGAMTGRLARTVMKICPELWKEIFEECSDGISAYNFEKHVRRSNAMGNDDILDNGGPGPIIAKIYRAMGYDGIIMVNVSDTFEKMKMDKNSNHYIVWKANQVKSALGNKGTYNRRKPSITESSR